MTNITIHYEDGPTKGRYSAHVEGYEDHGEMTLSKVGEHQIIIDHTGVPDSLRGLGVGKALADYVVEDARAKNLKIIPLCPFFKAQALKNPD